MNPALCILRQYPTDSLVIYREIPAWFMEVRALVFPTMCFRIVYRNAVKTRQPPEAILQDSHFRSILWHGLKDSEEQRFG